MHRYQLPIPDLSRLRNLSTNTNKFSLRKIDKHAIELITQLGSLKFNYKQRVRRKSKSDYPFPNVRSRVQSSNQNWF